MRQSPFRDITAGGGRHEGRAKKSKRGGVKGVRDGVLSLEVDFSNFFYELFLQLFRPEKHILTFRELMSFRLNGN